MKIKLVIFITFLLLSMFSQATLAQGNSAKAASSNLKYKSIYDIDFRNFSFPWSKKFGEGEKKKSFVLKNGKFARAVDDVISLESVSYEGSLIDDEDVALVVIKWEDGNADYQALYVYSLKNGKPTVLDTFEFGYDNVYFGTVYVVHSELVIGRYIQKSGDAECCPSILELSYYKWKSGKFTLQGEPQKSPNYYVERAKKNQIN